MISQEGFFSHLFIQFLLSLVLHLKSEFCDLVLCRQLIHSHHPAESEAPACHELSTHDSIEHLMEVDKAIVDVDAHLEYSSINLFVRCKYGEAHIFSHFARKLLNEIRDLLWLHFHTLIKPREMLPSILKVLKVVLKSLQTVVFFQVIL